MPRHREPSPSPAEEAPFLASIRESPADDAPRLVFADWLEERGDARAELIRVQCRLARLELDDESRGALVVRELELLRRHGRRWTAALPPLEGLRWGIESMELDACNATRVRRSKPVVFARGLPALATVERSALWNDALYRNTPACQFHLTRDGNLLAEAAAPPQFWDWCEGMVGDAVQLPLIERQLYPRLERLAIHLPSQAAVEALARTEMPSLRWLRLIGAQPSRQPESWVIPYSNYRRLSDWKSLAEVRSLDAMAGAAGTELELLQSPHLTQLRELRSTGGQYGADLEYVVSEPKFSRLVRLVIGLPFNPKGAIPAAERFAASPHLDRLEHLQLFGNEDIQGDDPLRIMLAAQNLPGLRSLDLEGMWLSAPLRGAQQTTLLRPLRVLRLSFCELGAEDIQVLAADGVWPEQLEELYLNDNNIDDAGAFALAAQRGVERLRVLDLEGSYSHISSAARHALWKRCGKALKL